MSAPTGRIIRVNMMANETDLISVPNSLAISFRTKTIRKKSNASRVQPKYAAIVTFLCSRVQLISIVLLSIGVGALALTLISCNLVAVSNSSCHSIIGERPGMARRAP